MSSPETMKSPASGFKRGGFFKSWSEILFFTQLCMIASAQARHLDQRVTIKNHMNVTLYAYFRGCLPCTPNTWSDPGITISPGTQNAFLVGNEISQVAVGPCPANSDMSNGFLQVVSYISK